MRKSRNLAVFSLIIGLFLMNSCGKFNRIQKSDDWKEIYAGAIKYYEEEEYYKSSVLLDLILPIIKGTAEAEKANFMYAYTYYYQQQYILSANYFKSFAVLYSRSEDAMEANYMHAYSLYLQAPDYNLDQTSTYEAIAAFEAFINRYPTDEYSQKGTVVLDEMQRKLEKKAYENAKQYYKLRRYKSAIISFGNFEKDFPDSKMNEEILYLSVEAEFDYAKASILSKQKERFGKTIEFYEKFIDKYPTSEFLKDAEVYYGNSIEELEKLGKNK